MAVSACIASARVSNAEITESLLQSTSDLMRGNARGVGGFNPLTYARLLLEQAISECHASFG